MKNNNNPIFINNNLDYQSNYLNHTLLKQNPEKLKKKKVRTFLRIKRKIKTNNNIKRITNKKKKKNKSVPKGNQNMQISTLSILSLKESLVESLSSSSIQLNEEDRFDSEKFRIDLLNSNNNNNNNNRINIEGNYDSEENIQYLRNETIFIGLSFNSKSLIHKEL